MNDNRKYDPAFPVITRDGEIGHQCGPQEWQFPGLSIRDYFAAHAPDPRDQMILADHVAYRYRYADAMIAERSK